MTAELPGLTVGVAPPAALPPPLRTDVAGFIGATRRGPIGTPVRVESLNDYRDVFGDLDPAAATSYAVRGYYENGGELAWIIQGGRGRDDGHGRVERRRPGRLPAGHGVPGGRHQPGKLGRGRPGDDLVPVRQPGRTG